MRRAFETSGQADLEDGIAWFGFKLNFSTMSVRNDPVADNQTKASSGTDAFRGKERLKYAILDLRRNSSAVICDLDNDVAVFSARGHGDSSSAVRRMNGVVD